MRSLLIWGLVLGLVGTAAHAQPYWFAFEFSDPNDLPQGSGWLRRYQPQPFGVIENGILTYDSNDPQTYDFWEYFRPGALDPGPNEIFVGEWRLWTEWVSFYWGDPSVAVASDDGWALCFTFSPTSIHSYHEYVDIPIPPADPNSPAFHTYALLSVDMRDYELYIDGALVREGWFAHRFATSLVIWGDGGDGVASAHHWDYFRCGVASAPLTGDVNCDGTVDFADINPFVQVLTDGEGYQGTYSGCWPENADINADGTVDFGDINPFVELLTSE